MYRQLIEWLAWNEDINGDNRFPDNNEFFFNWDPVTKTFGRSGIHHDVLGSFNWMFFQDIAGLQPRTGRPGRAVADRRRLRPLHRRTT